MAVYFDEIRANLEYSDTCRKQKYQQTTMRKWRTGNQGTYAEENAWICGGGGAGGRGTENLEYARARQALAYSLSVHYSTAPTSAQV